MQERLTEQIYLALCCILDTEDVAVITKARHYCVKARGIKDVLSTTMTSKMGGRFREVSDLRREFMSLLV